MTDATPDGSGDRTGWRKPLAAVICALWVGALAWLAITAANPVTVNIQQVRQAAELGAILAVNVLDAHRGLCQVSDVLSPFSDDQPPPAIGSEISVSNLSQAGVRSADARYILPVVRRSDSYRVIPIHLPRELPLVYPDTADSRRQIAAVLEGREPF